MLKALLVLLPLLALAVPAFARSPQPVVQQVLASAHPVATRIPVAAPLSPSQQCAVAIAATEQKLAIAPGLLTAIGRVESGRIDPVIGRAGSWPWSINAEGADSVFATKEEAIAAVQALQARGVRSIDVGCVQVNLMYHPAAFATLDEAFDPQANVAYGGRFLKALYAELGAWPDAAAAYHSRTPEQADPYRQRVMMAWTGSPGPVGGRAPAAPAKPVSLNTNTDVYGIWPPPGVVYGAIPPAGFAYRCCGGATSPTH